MSALYTRESKRLSDAEKTDIFGLWNAVYPENLTMENIMALEEYLSGLQTVRHILLADAHGKTLAWAFSFLREGERWFAILIDSTLQKQGHGRHLLNLLKAGETGLNGWVIDHNKDRKADGTAYVSPLAFYMKNDFKVLPETRLELDKISAVKIRWDKERRV